MLISCTVPGEYVPNCLKPCTLGNAKEKVIGNLNEKTIYY